MHVIFQSIATGSYVIIGLLCLLFGANRGSRLKRVNGHVVFFFIYLMAFWYILNVRAQLVLTSWIRDDGPQDIELLRFIAGTTILITFTILVTYRMKEDSLDLFLHFVVSLFTNLFLFMSVIAYEKSARSTWLIASIVFSVILLIHLLRESMHEDITSPRFVRTIMLFIASYTFIYIASMIWGPLHEGLISSSTQEIIMVTADLIISLLCSIPIVHYGWALSHKIETQIRPGQLTAEFHKLSHSPMEAEKFIENLHSF